MVKIDYCLFHMNEKGLLLLGATFFFSPSNVSAVQSEKTGMDLLYQMDALPALCLISIL